MGNSRGEKKRKELWQREMRVTERERASGKKKSIKRMRHIKIYKDTRSRLSTFWSKCQ